MTRFSIAALLLAGGLSAQQPAKDPISWTSPIIEKNFYLLSAIERDGRIRQAVANDNELTKIASEKRASVSEAIKSCGKTGTCYADALLWKQNEIDKVRAALERLSQNNSAWQPFVAVAHNRALSPI